MELQCRITSATVCGAEAVPVSVEVSIGPGLPGIAIVGMADTSIQEARERVRSAIKASGFAMPNDKIVVNLSPCDMKKIGSGFDLPIALGILAATGQIDRRLVEGRLVAGELSLYGEARCVSGDLAFCICASRLGMDYLSALRPRAPMDSIDQLCIRNLASLTSEEPFTRALTDTTESGFLGSGLADYGDIAGHECAKRAIAIAVAGRHGLLMVGPPGSGKTMLASRIPSIMPPLDEAQALETAAVHSIAGESVDGILQGIPPFRHPHHSATTAGLLGGGVPVAPGEASLAHNGVLFLDELAEFRPATLQALRQPIEDGAFFITRATGKIRMPSDFMLIAATNPCPCGYFGDKDRDCRCTKAIVDRYLSRIGGPLIDRFDMQLDVHRVASIDLFDNARRTSSEELAQDVAKCRQFSSWRLSRRESGDSDMTDRHIDDEGIFKKYDLEDEAAKFATSIADTDKMSARGIGSILKVSRTIADMEEAEQVRPEHIAQAHAFRMSSIMGRG